MGRVRSRQGIGKWELDTWLGAGGNGEVWLAHGDGESVAIKFLTKITDAGYERFRREADAMLGCKDIAGILPLIDVCLPKQRKAGAVPPWIAMPVAIPAAQALAGQSAAAVVEACAAWAHTLALLHARGIAHRDIKPANLYRLGTEWTIGDFGLVRLPRRTRVTRSKETVGPRWTIAPEMRRHAFRADGAPADVYSLAKTLWILLTGRDQGFEGQYSPSSAVGFDSRLVEGEFLHPLEGLMAAATDHDPAARPTARDVEIRLRDWLKALGIFAARSAANWAYALNGLLPKEAPTRIIWESLPSIVAVISACGRIKNANHMFYPSGGGNDLESAALSVEPDCIVIKAGGSLNIVKPRRLILEFLGPAEWSYIRLELDELAAIVINGSDPNDNPVYDTDRDRFGPRQEFVQVSEGQYAPFSSQESGYYWNEAGHRQRLPATAKRVCRYLRGDFVVFGKMSPYNRERSTYDARHATVSTDDFRQYIVDQMTRGDGQLRKLPIDTP